MKRRVGKWLPVIAVMVVAGCFVWNHRPVRLSEQEKQHVSELTQNLKSHCVGRYLIDMPAGVLVSGGAKVDEVKIEAEAMSREAYLEKVKARQAELRGTKSLDAYPFLYEDDVIDGPDTHYFISRGNPGYGPSSRVIEAYKWDRGYRFKLEIQADDFLHPDQTDEPSIRQFDVKNDVPEKKRLVFDMVSRLRGRREDEIPTEAGLCFLGGFLAGKAGDKEDAWTQFVLEANRDVSIGFGSNSGIRESNTLLQRGSGIEIDLRSVNGRTLRKGAVVLQGMNAEEWLFVGKTESGVTATRCTLEANSITSSARSPLVTLDLSTGSPNAYLDGPVIGASMTEGEAIALWDIVSRTLRPRPNGF
jgi:hypothetical protein